MINEQEINLFAFLFPRSWLETTKNTQRRKISKLKRMSSHCRLNTLGLAGGQVVYVCYQKVTTELELTNHPQMGGSGRTILGRSRPEIWQVSIFEMRSPKSRSSL